MNLKTVFIGIILVIVAFIFVLQIIPVVESVNTDNITNETTAAIAEMGIWVIPVLALVGIFYGAFKLIRSRKGD